MCVAACASGRQVSRCNAISTGGKQRTRELATERPAVVRTKAHAVRQRRFGQWLWQSDRRDNTAAFLSANTACATDGCASVSACMRTPTGDQCLCQLQCSHNQPCAPSSQCCVHSTPALQSGGMRQHVTPLGKSSRMLPSPTFTFSKPRLGMSMPGFSRSPAALGRSAPPTWKSTAARSSLQV